MRLPSSLLLVVFLVVTASGTPQRRPAANTQPDQGFGSGFFDELRSLFGRLRQSDLDRAFERSRAIRCSDLAGGSLDWKQVAFMNDDRKLGDWHFESIEEVKGDLTRFVFSGECAEEQGPLTVATFYPVQESATRYSDGRISLSEVAMKNNAPVPVRFNSSEESYVFELPYVYLDTNKRSSTPLYTLSPPLRTSRPIPELAIEFRCKTSGDNNPTYLFLLCRTRMIDHTLSEATRSRNQPAGNSAYYILSDGKEARATVRLVFGDVNGDAPDTSDQPTEPAEAAQSDTEEIQWQPAAPTMRLRDVEEQEFRLSFNMDSWTSRIEGEQRLASQAFMADSTNPNAASPSCLWRPIPDSPVREVLGTELGHSVVYTLRFTGNSRSPVTAIFEVEDETRQSLSSLRCSFPTREAPVDVTVADWLSVVGPHVNVLIRRR